MILAIETSTNICSVAFENGAGEVFEKRTESRGSHSEKLFLFIKELMKEHEFEINNVDAVLVSEGPGSYTGLRIAASGVKGLLFGTGIELYGVQTLASFAGAALEKKPEAARIHAIIDARREHVYHQQFEVAKGGVEAVKVVEIIPIKSFEQMIQPKDIIIGTGLDRLDESATAKACCFGKEAISGRSLIQLYHRKEAANFMHVVVPQAFDPQYYTSNQLR